MTTRRSQSLAVNARASLGTVLNQIQVGLLRDFREVVSKSDGYYLKDYSTNAKDAKIVKSLEAVFNGTNQNFPFENTAVETACLIQPSAISEYIYHVAITDLTISETIYNNQIHIPAFYPYVAGFMLSVDTNKLKIYLSSSNTEPGKQVITSTLTIPDNNYHKITLKFDRTSLPGTVSFKVDEGAEEVHAITVNGASLSGVGGGISRFGGYTTSAKMKLANFECKIDGVTTANIPFSTNHLRVWDIVSGTISIANSSATWGVANDFYPANILNGYEYYAGANYQSLFIYVPNKSDGTLLTPTISGRAKFGAVAKSGFYNYSESQIQPNPTNDAALATAGFDDTYFWSSYDLMRQISSKVFLHGEATGLKELLIYSADKTANEKTKIHAYLTNVIAKAAIQFGDSIALGAGANADLPVYLDGDLVNAKILIINYQWTSIPAAKTVNYAVLNKSNSIVTSNTQNGFDLAYAYNYSNPIYFMKYATGGSVAGDDPTLHNGWNPLDTAGLMPKLLQLVNRGIEQMRKNGHEPLFEIFACLGTNDAGFSTTMRDAFKINFITAIGAIRAVVGSDAVVNLLRLKKQVGDKTVVWDLTNLIPADLTDCIVFDSEDVTTADTVHPTTAGNIQIADRFYNKTNIVAES